MQAFNYQSEQSLEFKPPKQHKNKQTNKQTRTKKQQQQKQTNKKTKNKKKQ